MTIKYPQAMWADVLAKRTGLSRTDAKKVIRVIGDETRRKLAAGEDVRLFGIGRIAVIEAKARIGRNRAAGFAPVAIPARRRIKFYPLESLNKAARGA